jgi:hypothetical protein
MATQVQFEVFRAAYQQETERYTRLESRAKFYLTIVTFYLGAIAFKFSDVLVFAKEYRIATIFYIGTGILLLASLLFAILSMRIRKYEAPFDPEKIIKSFGESPPKDDDFLDERLVDYAVATNRNRTVDNRVANLLSVSSWLLFAGISLQLITFIIALSNP